MEAAEQDVSLGSPNKFVTPEEKQSEGGAQGCGDGRSGGLSGQVATTSMLTDVEREQLTLELTKVEEEVATLRQVLAAKEQRVWSIKRSLGMTPLSWHTVSGLMQDVQASTAYKRTTETLSVAGQRTTSAISTVGSALSRRLGDVKSFPTYKSLEEKVGSTVSTIKARVSRSTSRSGSISEGLGAADVIQEAEEAEEEEEEEGVKIPAGPVVTGGPGAADMTA